jgi:hypothetical protein
MQISDLWNSQIVFDAVPSPDTHYFIPMVIVFTLFIIGAAAILIFMKGFLRKMFGHYVPLLMTTGALGLIHLVSRFESLPWLASIFYFMLVIAMFLIWFAIILIWFTRFTPKYLKEKEIELRFEKYLPKAKKKPTEKVAKRK